MRINVRNLNGDFSGVQRYTTEMLKYIPRLKTIGSSAPSGIKGHTWEQLLLPLELGNEMLWSPSNTGPIYYRNQILTLHDIAPLDYPEWFDKKYVTLNKYALPILVKNVKHIITVSEYSRRNIIVKLDLPVSKVTSLPLAAGDQFIPLTIEEQQERRTLNCWPERYFLSVGSLEPRKNLKNLFLAWQNWRNRSKDLKLLVAGGQGKVFSSIGFEMIPEDVILLGPVPDVNLPSLYACAEAFVYPSIYEGFGLPPLEAMASGTPVITSKVTSIPEVVGDCALYIDPYSVEDLVSAMDKLSYSIDLRGDMRLKGLMRAKMFSWERTAELTQQILNIGAI